MGDLLWYVSVVFLGGAAGWLSAWVKWLRIRAWEVSKRDVRLRAWRRKQSFGAIVMGMYLVLWYVQWRYFAALSATRRAGNVLSVIVGVGALGNSFNGGRILAFRCSRANWRRAAKIIAERRGRTRGFPVMGTGGTNG